MTTRRTLCRFLSVSIPLLVTLLPITRSHAQWTQSAQTAGRYVTGLTMHGATLFTSTSDSAVYRSTDNGDTWIASKAGLPKDILTITSTGTTLFAGRDAGVYRSTNNGDTWTPTNNGLSNPSVYTLFVSGTTIFAGTAGSGVFRSTDNGANWAAANAGMTSAIVQTIAGGSSNLFAGTRAGGVYRSTDNGSNWIQVNTGLTSLNVLTLCTTGSDLYTGSAGGGIFRSTNNGAIWTPAPTGPTTSSINSLVTFGTNIFAGGPSGGFSNVFLSTNSGDNWTSVSGTLPQTTVNTLAIAGTYIVAGTAANGIWRRNLSEITAIAARIEGEIPGAISLDQNYPNPFNPSTTIRYSLPHHYDVTLSVYTTLGQKVSDLVNETQEAGNYEFRLDATALASGAYLYRLRVGDVVETKRMLIVK
jgi:photosystem II stability/assembly factor-like uncharacterized protein